MLNSEIIVGFWFVPVALFIVIPLSMLCIWTVHKFLGKIANKIELVHNSAKAARDEAPVSGLRPRAAV